MEVTVSGTVETFDQEAFKAALGASVRVDREAISLNVTAASVKVVATILVVEEAVESDGNVHVGYAVAALQALARNPSAFSEAVGVAVEAVAPLIVWHRTVQMPLPPPPSPPSPSPLPFPPPPSPPFRPPSLPPEYPPFNALPLDDTEAAVVGLASQLFTVEQAESAAFTASVATAGTLVVVAFRSFQESIKASSAPSIAGSVTVSAGALMSGIVMMLSQVQSIKSLVLLNKRAPPSFTSFGAGFAWGSMHLDLGIHFEDNNATRSFGQTLPDGAAAVPAEGSALSEWELGSCLPTT